MPDVDWTQPTQVPGALGGFNGGDSPSSGPAQSTSDGDTNLGNFTAGAGLTPTPDLQAPEMGAFSGLIGLATAFDSPAADPISADVNRMGAAGNLASTAQNVGQLAGVDKAGDLPQVFKDLGMTDPNGPSASDPAAKDPSASDPAAKDPSASDPPSTKADAPDAPPDAPAAQAESPSPPGDPPSADTPATAAPDAPTPAATPDAPAPAAPDVPSPAAAGPDAAGGAAAPESSVLGESLGILGTMGSVVSSFASGWSYGQEWNQDVGNSGILGTAGKDNGPNGKQIGRTWSDLEGDAGTKVHDEVKKELGGGTVGELAGTAMGLEETLDTSLVGTGLAIASLPHELSTGIAHQAVDMIDDTEKAHSDLENNDPTLMKYADDIPGAGWALSALDAGTQETDKRVEDMGSGLWGALKSGVSDVVHDPVGMLTGSTERASAWHWLNDE